jgi:hypothetical protein
MAQALSASRRVSMPSVTTTGPGSWARQTTWAQLGEFGVHARVIVEQHVLGQLQLELGEQRLRRRPALGVVPAEQRLEAGHRAIRRGHSGLAVELKLAGLDPPAGSRRRGLRVRASSASSGR